MEKKKSEILVPCEVKFSGNELENTLRAMAAMGVEITDKEDVYAQAAINGVILMLIMKKTNSLDPLNPKSLMAYKPHNSRLSSRFFRLNDFMDEVTEIIAVAPDSSIAIQMDYDESSRLNDLFDSLYPFLENKGIISQDDKQNPALMYRIGAALITRIVEDVQQANCDLRFPIELSWGNNNKIYADGQAKFGGITLYRGNIEQTKPGVNFFRSHFVR